MNRSPFKEHSIEFEGCQFKLEFFRALTEPPTEVMVSNPFDWCDCKATMLVNEVELVFGWKINMRHYSLEDCIDLSLTTFLEELFVSGKEKAREIAAVFDAYDFKKSEEERNALIHDVLSGMWEWAADEFGYDKHGVPKSTLWSEAKVIRRWAESMLESRTVWTPYDLKYFERVRSVALTYSIRAYNVVSKLCAKAEEHIAKYNAETTTVSTQV